eukprot:m.165602 g.165602  ORF g.165602 m.165602 type:complete len:52 (+) comp12582_c0_seq1:53-208(+)
MNPCATTQHKETAQHKESKDCVKFIFVCTQCFEVESIDYAVIVTSAQFNQT